MNNNDEEVKAVLSSLLTMIVPDGMTPQERRELATRAGVSEETLRKNIRRKSLNADTLIRLLLARGVSAETLTNFSQSNLSMLSRGEAEWLEFGQKISETERIEFIELLKYLGSRWCLKK